MLIIWSECLMFYNCKSLISLPDLSKWKTGNINDMQYMFYNCKSLLFLQDYQNGILIMLVI